MTVTQNGSNPIPIDIVLLHVGAHTDEHEAYRRLKAYGERKFPGVSKAKVKFTRGVQEYQDSFFDANKILPVGCAKTRFDEHRKEVERLPGECATTLVSKYLGIEHDAVLKRMETETLRCDAESGVGLTELPELVKMLNRRLKNADEAVLKWGIDILNAIHRHLVFNTAKANGEKTALELFAELEKLENGKRMPDERAKKSVRQSLAGSNARLQSTRRANKPEPIFELAFIVEAIYRTDAVKPEDMTEWLWFPLEHLYQDQAAFWTTVDTLKKQKTCWHSVYAEWGGRKRRLKLCFVHTDDPMMSRASRHKQAGGADITVVRSSRGNVQISLSGKNLPGLNLDEAAAMLRWHALPKTGDERSEHREPVEPCDWETLKREGTHAAATEFYYFRKGDQLLNGSLTHPDTPASSLCSQAILGVLQHAFYPKGVKMWKQYRGIPVSTEAEAIAANQPAPEATPAADAKAPEPAPAPAPEPAQTAAAGESDIGEAFKNAKPKKSRSKKAASPKGEDAQAA
ncbi:MAG: hypothetical protein AAB699_02120 [Patescibacteria group bacterium]